jgi:hypothetical protein
MARHVGRWLLWWLALFWLWLLLVGEWNGTEVMAAASAGLLGATIVAVATAHARIGGRPRLRDLAASWTVPAMVLVDFWILVAVLVESAVRRRVVRGRFLARRGTPNAFRTYTSMLSPNAYVVDVDREERLVLVHDLVPFRKSEEPAT